jgi:predicted O-methyltransferase YrrM
MLPPSDILFAAAVTSILRPRLAIEIGTASGSSAAIIGKMIALRQAQADHVPSGPLVHTIDRKSEYVLDRAKPVGFAIETMTPELRDRVIVHAPQDSAFCRALVLDGELPFAFIDGNHRHPWPLADVLQVQQLMKSGWICLHDIDLPGVSERALAAGEQVAYLPAYGAKHVFDFWPYAKIQAGNIGVIRIPADRSLPSDLC